MTDIVSLAQHELDDINNEIDSIALHNQQRVLQAFIEHRVSAMHFANTNGYGYGDIGRDTLQNIFAQIFGTESAIVSPNILSGTHALTIALFGLLRPGDLLLSITGDVYDTLQTVISGADGSLEDFGVVYDKVDLINDDFDYQTIADKVIKRKPKVIYIQKSRGYSWRQAISCDMIKLIAEHIRSIDKDVVLFVDNCYGEFVERMEPTQVGCDVCAGSLIKNLGGSLAQTGGYIVGRSKLIQRIAGRLTSPSVGAEIGSYAYGYQYLYQGLFMAPHIVAQAVKTAMLVSRCMNMLGYDALPHIDQQPRDIVCSVKLNDRDKLIKFVQTVQTVSPVDSYALPTPWNMPGYQDQVIMAAGCFVQGASIELSCDAPIREPYIAYLQGGITYEHGIILANKLTELLSHSN
ncbi:MAG: methionine gamma-lyase family protein [Clostridia bacterium]|nr:methionine gamma-lyase family protein [Clostridia bacterium]